MYRSVLVVRDLSSEMQLLAMPMEEATAWGTIDALRSLFREHGVPPVIK